MLKNHTFEEKEVKKRLGVDLGEIWVAKGGQNERRVGSEER